MTMIQIQPDGDLSLSGEILELFRDWFRGFISYLRFSIQESQDLLSCGFFVSAVISVISNALTFLGFIAEKIFLLPAVFFRFLLCFCLTDADYDRLDALSRDRDPETVG